MNRVQLEQTLSQVDQIINPGVLQAWKHTGNPFHKFILKSWLSLSLAVLSYRNSTKQSFEILALSQP